MAARPLGSFVQFCTLWLDLHLGCGSVVVANLVLNIGSVSVTVVLIVRAAFLVWDGSPDWVRFFNLGVYSGIWNLLWSAVQQVCEEPWKRRKDAVGLTPGVFWHCTSWAS